MNCQSIKVMEINNRRGRNKIVGGAMFENFSKIYNRGVGGGADDYSVLYSTTAFPNDL